MPDDMPQHPPAPDLERRPPRRQRQAHPLAAGIAHRRGPVVDRRTGRHHVHELHLVGRRHHHEPRQAAEIGKIERARMGRPVGADEPRPVEREPQPVKWWLPSYKSKTRAT